jgi:hypothetical protein
MSRPRADLAENNTELNSGNVVSLRLFKASMRRAEEAES